MELSFEKEIEQLRLGAGDVFEGEGILAVTKALLQAGVSYVGGYQGAPVSHLLDVLIQAKDLLNELGVQVHASASEASAAALLGASINYPVRGAVTWKSIVGTNVASDALSNLASAGVKGGALIVLGEDSGEGASVIQERSLAFALKSGIWLLDPRPELSTIVQMVEESFELSEASHSPVMLQLRIRACHMSGEFIAKDNIRPKYSVQNKLDAAAFDYDVLSHPPATFRQEVAKVEDRLPLARRFIVERQINEIHQGEIPNLGLIFPGGLFNTVASKLQSLGLADSFGDSRLSLLVLNAVHPLVPEQVASFCKNKHAVLVVEEGHPAFLEDAVNAVLHKAQLPATVYGKDLFGSAGEYNNETLITGLLEFLNRHELSVEKPAEILSATEAVKEAERRLGKRVPDRPPTFCVGCPERPVFTALKLLRQEAGQFHVSADIGCHALATFPPFDSGNTILGYGMSMASSLGVARFQKNKPIAIMGDGGFWHNGLISGVTNSAFNGDDSILIVLENGYSSATGMQAIPNTTSTQETSHRSQNIINALRSVGVKWLQNVSSYDVKGTLRALRRAAAENLPGPKVIVATGECQLVRQRRLRKDRKHKIRNGERVVQARYGVDETICTGDHSCIRLSGCPSLTLKPSRDLLRPEPVAHVDAGCVGCGHCGEVAEAAQLCPSFYRVEIVSNPTRLERFTYAIRGWLLKLPTKPEATA